MNIPYISKDQMKQVDDLMINHYRIELLQMMEHAGYNTADFIRQRFGKESKVTILAGKGGNGGGVLVAARRLHSWGYDISIVLAQEKAEMKDIPFKQVEILEKLGVKFNQNIPQNSEIILDGLVGYSLQGDLRTKTKELAEQANRTECTKISLDLPSGLDADNGPTSVVFEADYTLTLALPKISMQSSESRQYLGQVHLIDIGILPEIYEQLNIEIEPIFAISKSSIIEL